jgi:hypothetical protein
MCQAYSPLSHLPSCFSPRAEELELNCASNIYTTTPTNTQRHDQSPALGILDSSVAFIQTAIFPSMNLSGVAKAGAHIPSIEAYHMGEFGGRMLTFNEPSLPLGSSLNDRLPLLFSPYFSVTYETSGGKSGNGSSCVPTEAQMDLDVGLGPAVIEATALIAAAYLASDNEFFIIHGATSLYSLLVAMCFLTPHQRRLALVYWWKACMAVLVAENFPGLDKLYRIIDNWKAGGHVDVVMGESCVVDVVDGTAEEKEGTKKLLVDPVKPGDSVTEEEWWHQALQRASRSTDVHVSKGVYVMWR